MPGLRERNKERRRQEILSAAQDLFARQGYGATAVSEIAARASVAEGTVFNHFPTKGDLLLELMAHENTRVAQRLAAMKLAPDSDAREAIAAYFLVVTEESFALVDRATWREVAALLVTAGQSPFALRYLELRAALRRNLLVLLAELSANGRLPPDDHGALADLLWRAFWGLFQFLIASENLQPADLHRSIARDLDLIVPQHGAKP